MRSLRLLRIKSSWLFDQLKSSWVSRKNWECAFFAFAVFYTA